MPPTTQRAGTGSPGGREDAELAAQVMAVHEESKGSYGSPGAHAALQAQAAGTPASGSPG